MGRATIRRQLAATPEAIDCGENAHPCKGADPNEKFLLVRLENFSGGTPPADRIQEPVQLALRVVKASGSAPAVRAAKDRLDALARNGVPQCPGGQIKGFIPRHSDKSVAPAHQPVIGIATKLAFAQHRACHPVFGIDGVMQNLRDLRRVGIVLGWRYLRHLPATVGDNVVAPMRADECLAGFDCFICSLGLIGSGTVGWPERR
jgi:hypothetical protein